PAGLLDLCFLARTRTRTTQVGPPVTAAVLVRVPSLTMKITGAKGHPLPVTSLTPEGALAAGDTKLGCGEVTVNAIPVVEPARGQRHRAGIALPAAGGTDLRPRERLVRIEPAEQPVQLRQRRHQTERCSGLLTDHEALEVPRHVLAHVAKAPLLTHQPGEQLGVSAHHGRDLAKCWEGRGRL